MRDHPRSSTDCDGTLWIRYEDSIAVVDVEREHGGTRIR